MKIKTFLICFQPYERHEHPPLLLEVAKAESILQLYSTSKALKRIASEQGWGKEDFPKTEKDAKLFINEIDTGGFSWVDVFEVGSNNKLKHICGPQAIDPFK
mgnify:CR=1 FL=1